MEPSNNTETDEMTIAMRRKRAQPYTVCDTEKIAKNCNGTFQQHRNRRSDHCDEKEEGTTRSPLFTSSAVTTTRLPPDSVLGLFRDFAGDSDDFDDNRPQNPTDKFLQPIGSPSPGGSSTTAAEDTDNDDFRGPVSADFFRLEQSTSSGDLKMQTRFGSSRSINNNLQF